VTNLKITIKALNHGWTDLALIIDEQERMFCFEYVPNDPLYDLLESAIRIMGRVDSTIIFHNNSHQEILSVKSIEKGLCCIEAEGIHAFLTVKHFARAVLRMFDSYVFDFSRSEYNAHWGSFPESDLEKLRNLYRS